MVHIEKDDYQFIQKLLNEQLGFNLGEGKVYLLEVRLSPVAKRFGLTDIHGLVQRLRLTNDAGIREAVCTAMTTNETQFFRDTNPFEAFRKKVLPDLIQKNKDTRELNIWSAACSTGQEPYSVAITLREYFPELLNWKVSILATDISSEVLTKARNGIYDRYEVSRGLPLTHLTRYFAQNNDKWHVVDKIKKLIEFKSMNLSGPWPAMPKMDLVLLRNVMIYFDEQTKKNILAKVKRLLKPGGYMILGCAETTINIDPDFGFREIEKTIFYQLKT